MKKEPQKDKIIEIVKKAIEQYSLLDYDLESGEILSQMDDEDIDHAAEDIAEEICQQNIFRDRQSAYSEGYIKGCSAKMAYDYVACAKKYAVKDFAEKLKEAIHERDYIQGYAEIGLIDEVDELLKEYTK